MDLDPVDQEYESLKREEERKSKRIKLCVAFVVVIIAIWLIALIASPSCSKEMDMQTMGDEFDAAKFIGEGVWYEMLEKSVSKPLKCVRA